MRVEFHHYRALTSKMMSRLHLYIKPIGRSNARWFSQNGVERGYLVKVTAVDLCPPPPPPIESGGYTYARSSSRESPISGERIYPLSRVLVTIGNYKDNISSGFFREIFQRLGPKYPLSWENGNTHAAPLCIRVGGGGGVAIVGST